MRYRWYCTNGSQVTNIVEGSPTRIVNNQRMGVRKMSCIPNWHFSQYFSLVCHTIVLNTKLSNLFVYHKKHQHTGQYCSATFWRGLFPCFMYFTVEMVRAVRWIDELQSNLSKFPSVGSINYCYMLHTLD